MEGKDWKINTSDPHFIGNFWFTKDRYILYLTNYEQSLRIDTPSTINYVPDLQSSWAVAQQE
jgi:hypothetical protein